MTKCHPLTCACTKVLMLVNHDAFQSRFMASNLLSKIPLKSFASPVGRKIKFWLLYYVKLAPSLLSTFPCRRWKVDKRAMASQACGEKYDEAEHLNAIIVTTCTGSKHYSQKIPPQLLLPHPLTENSVSIDPLASPQVMTHRRRRRRHRSFDALCGIPVDETRRSGGSF